MSSTVENATEIGPLRVDMREQPQLFSEELRAAFRGLRTAQGREPQHQGDVTQR